MYCPNCGSDVEVKNGYCTKCGTAVNTRLCPMGHVMDPSWTECKYCPPGSGSASAGAGAPADVKGRTLVESGSTAPPPPGGFVKGATLLEDSPAGFGGGVTPGKGRTVVDSSLKQGGKAKTVFDSGVASSPAEAKKVLPKLVGWLVSFSHDESGADYRIREGRNVIGADQNDCEIAIAEDTSISTKHAFLMYRDGRFQLRDNDSTNGTYVNGQDIFGEGSVTLKDGDVIRFGSTECKLYVINN